MTAIASPGRQSSRMLDRPTERDGDGQHVPRCEAGTCALSHQPSRSGSGQWMELTGTGRDDSNPLGISPKEEVVRAACLSPRVPRIRIRHIADLLLEAGHALDPHVDRPWSGVLACGWPGNVEDPATAAHSLSRMYRMTSISRGERRIFSRSDRAISDSSSMSSSAACS
jgi:hypothetical protein